MIQQLFYFYVTKIKNIVAKTLFSQNQHLTSSLQKKFKKQFNQIVFIDIYIIKKHNIDPLMELLHIADNIS